MIRYLVVAAAACCLLLLAGCGQTTTLSDVHPSGPTITPNGDGQSDVLLINYTIGQPALVTAYLKDTQGNNYPLRDQVLRMPSAQPYTLRFDGTVQSDQPPVVQRVLPDGEYTYVVEATPEAGGPPVQESGTFSVQDAASELPLIEALKVVPAIVTPNEDAREDVAIFSYRLPITATVSINIKTDTETIPFINGVEEGPYEQSHIWDAKRPNGALLPSGVYTYTVRAADRIGNVVEQVGNLTIASPGRTEAHITYADVAPTAVALNNVITVTVRVKNTGNVPIRTQGPAPGFHYEMNVPYSAIEDQKWAEKGGGFWRVGLDYGGGNGYPYRWAITSRPPDQWSEPGVADELLPGEEVTITGTLTLQKREDKMTFFVGLIHEGVGYPEHRKAVTIVEVGF